MNHFKISFLLIFISVLIVSTDACRRKYKNDPFISFKSPRQRIIGDWELFYYGVNGADITETYKQDSLHYCFLYFDAVRGGMDSDHDMGFENCTFTYGTGGHYFSLSGKYLEMESFLIPETFVKIISIKFSINKLYKNMLWLSTKQNGNEYFLKFHKIMEH